MALQPFAVRPRGYYQQFRGSKTGPRPAPPDRAESDTLVTPLARGLAVLASFGPGHVWMGNKQIVLETGLPAATVSRLLKSLVSLGYLHYDGGERKYRLAAAALGLGYAALATGDIRRIARAEIRKFAEATNTYVSLSTRDRRNLVVVDSHLGSQAVLALDMTPGTRLSIAGSVAGAALLSALPAQEREYLLEQLERRVGAEWPAHRRRIAEKISQIHELGFCMSPGEWVPELSSISVPISLPEGSPWVLSCSGRSSQMPRARMERELGPRLVAVAGLLHDELAALQC